MARGYALALDVSDDAVDCKTAYLAGTKTPIVSLGLDGACTSATIGNIGVGDALGTGHNQACSFKCSVAK